MIDSLHSLHSMTRDQLEATAGYLEGRRLAGELAQATGPADTPAGVTAEEDAALRAGAVASIHATITARSTGATPFAEGVRFALAGDGQ
jgi:hypothetical protein